MRAINKTGLTREEKEEYWNQVNWGGLVAFQPISSYNPAQDECGDINKKCRALQDAVSQVSQEAGWDCPTVRKMVVLNRMGEEKWETGEWRGYSRGRWAGGWGDDIFEMLAPRWAMAGDPQRQRYGVNLWGVACFPNSTQGDESIKQDRNYFYDMLVDCLELEKKDSRFMAMVGRAFEPLDDNWLWDRQMRYYYERITEYDVGRQIWWDPQFVALFWWAYKAYGKPDTWQGYEYSRSVKMVISMISNQTLWPHGFRFRIDVNVSSTISADVTCTNMGDWYRNVTGFLPWGNGLPRITVETPDGEIYQAASRYNATYVLEWVLLRPGGSIWQTYDLLGPWRKEGGGGVVAGSEVFSKPGSYKVTARYQPFLREYLTGGYPAGERIVLVWSASFVLPSGFQPYLVPVHLYVSDQSFDIPEADIRITLDGDEVFRRVCPVGDQHNWFRVDLSLAQGHHLLEAEELTSATFKEVEFDASSERWVAVDFWYFARKDPQPFLNAWVSNQSIVFS
jgi:hypothetical protein